MVSFGKQQGINTMQYFGYDLYPFQSRSINKNTFMNTECSTHEKTQKFWKNI
jgi:hypothetical protein